MSDRNLLDRCRLCLDGKKYTGIVSEASKDLHVYFGGIVTTCRPSGTVWVVQIMAGSHHDGFDSTV